MKNLNVAALGFGASGFLLAYGLQRDRLLRLRALDNRESSLYAFKERLKEIKGRRRNLDAGGWLEFVQALALTSSSGVDILTAFESSIRRTKGILNKELRQVFIISKSGTHLGDALKLSPYGPKFQRLADHLERAHILGTPVSSVLWSLAEEIRDRERNKTLARFNTLPLKLSVITVFFLLPPVIVVTVIPNILAFIGAGW